VAPYYPVTEAFDPELSLSEKDMEDLQSWGFNVVRLGVMWPGVAPSNGTFNQTYLDAISSIITKLGKYGIYTIVDCHQDLYTRLCCGEGAPDWAVDFGSFSLPFPIPVSFQAFPKDENDYPPISECLKYSFGLFYLAEQTMAAFQSLYDNRRGIQDAFISYWSKVAETFKDSPFVLGYELINEPFAGNVYTNPSLIIPGVADRTNLYPMYQRLHRAIRQWDDQHVIFYEGATNDLWEVGFTEGPGGPAFNDREAFAYHIYCAPQNPDGSPGNVIVCDAEDLWFYYLYNATIKRLGSGHFMTEFGAVSNNSNSISNLNFLTGQADIHLSSWAYWQFKGYQDFTTASLPGAESFYSEDGELQVNKVKALSRTYARATAGTPISMKFDPLTAKFELVYLLNTKVTQPTEIYLNEDFYYPNGYTFTLTPSEFAQAKSPGKNLLWVLVLPAAGEGAKVTVTIQPK
jgi:endoglycosylceramidase